MPVHARPSAAALALASIVMLLVACAGSGPARMSAATPPPGILHVSAAAVAGVRDGATAETAFATIQEAFDRVRPGGTVVIHPGIYHETPVLRTAGTAVAPITITADAIAPGRVVLTAADRSLREGRVPWRLEDAGLGLYSAPFAHLPARMLYSGTDLMPFPSLEGLRTFTLLDGYPGPRHGFYHDAGAGRIYVRLHEGGRHGDRDPRRHLMCAAPANAPGFAGTHIHRPEHANLLIATGGDAHVVVAGLTFETPGAAGVVTSAARLTVRDSWFRGCRFGVFGVRHPAAVVVEHCDFHQYPAFDDMAEVIALHRAEAANFKPPIYWWHRKGVAHDSEVMKTYETGIAGGIGSGWSIAGNRIHDAFDGISTWGVSDAVDLDIAGNRFERLVDNAVETENHARDVRIHGNDIVDVFEPISWQPLAGTPWPGPVSVHHNRIAITSAVAGLWPWQAGCFKFGASDRNWHEHPHMAAVPTDEVAVPDPGFLVHDNVILFPHGHLLTLPMPAGRGLANVRFSRNVMAVRSLAERRAFTGSRIVFEANQVSASEDAARAALMAGPDGRVVDVIPGLDGAVAGDGVGPREGPLPGAAAAP